MVEANMAPAPDAAAFLRESRASFAAAAAAGLAPYRLHYNGQITDSGGGGQLTLGLSLIHISKFWMRETLRI